MRATSSSFGVVTWSIQVLSIAFCSMASVPAHATNLTGDAPKTMRVDYFHTGGLGEEMFSLDRVVVEPLPWPGPERAETQPATGGAYRFSVLDADGALLHSQGFGSIFGEWETTSEASRMHRTFHESLRFSAPDHAVTVVVEKRGGDQSFSEVWRVEVDPADIFVDPSNPYDLQALAIEEHGLPAEKVDLLFLGDGYTAADCAKEFRADAERMAAALFAHEPFASRRGDFNVWGLCPPSPERGVSRPSTGRHVASPVGTAYDIFGSERYVLTYDNRAFRDIAAWAPYEFVEILVKNETYGGGGIYNLFATVAVDNDWSDYVFVHEFGHHFAGLADEYYTSPVAYQPAGEVAEPWEPNVTALHDPAQLKWADLVDAGTPLPTPWPKERFETHARGIEARRAEVRAQNRPESEMSALFSEQQAFETELLGGAEHADHVGAFQGANYDAQAFYRSQVDCVMFTRDPVPFCAVCRRALEEVIDHYVPRAD